MVTLFLTTQLHILDKSKVLELSLVVLKNNKKAFVLGIFEVKNNQTKNKICLNKKRKPTKISNYS